MPSARTWLTLYSQDLWLSVATGRRSMVTLDFSTNAARNLLTFPALRPVDARIIAQCELVNILSEFRRTGSAGGSLTVGCRRRSAGRVYKDEEALDCGYGANSYGSCRPPGAVDEDVARLGACVVVPSSLSLAIPPPGVADFLESWLFVFQIAKKNRQQSTWSPRSRCSSPRGNSTSRHSASATSPVQVKSRASSSRSSRRASWPRRRSSMWR